MDTKAESDEAKVIQNADDKKEEKTEETRTEETKTEEVNTEEVNTEEVKTEEVKTEEVKTEEVKTEEVKTEDVKKEEVKKEIVEKETKNEEKKETPGARQSKRSRKRTDFISYEVKKDHELEVPEGVGMPLGEIPNFEKRLGSFNRVHKMLKDLHRLAYPGQPCSKNIVKKDLRRFKGFAKPEDKDEFVEDKHTRLMKMHFKDIVQPMAYLLDVDFEFPIRPKPDICTDIIEVLFNPQPSGKEYRRMGKKKKTPKKEAPKKKKPKKKTPKKKTPKKEKKEKKKSGIKRPRNAYMLYATATRKKVKAEHPEATFAEQGKIMGKLWGELPDDQKEVYQKQAAELREEYEKKKAEEGGAENKKRKATPKKKKDVETESKDDDESSDEEPLAKKKKTNIEDEIKDAIRKILKEGDLDTLSVKKIRGQLKETFGDELVAKRKSMIKEFINSELEKL